MSNPSKTVDQKELWQTIALGTKTKRKQNGSHPGQVGKSRERTAKIIQLRAGLHCAYKISLLFTLVRRGHEGVYTIQNGAYELNSVFCGWP